MNAHRRVDDERGEAGSTISGDFHQASVRSVFWGSRRGSGRRPRCPGRAGWLQARSCIRLPLNPDGAWAGLLSWRRERAAHLWCPPTPSSSMSRQNSLSYCVSGTAIFSAAGRTVAALRGQLVGIVIEQFDVTDDAFASIAMRRVAGLSPAGAQRVDTCAVRRSACAVRRVRSAGQATSWAEGCQRVALRHSMLAIFTIGRDPHHVQDDPRQLITGGLMSISVPPRSSSGRTHCSTCTNRVIRWFCRRSGTWSARCRRRRFRALTVGSHPVGRLVGKPGTRA